MNELIELTQKNKNVDLNTRVDDFTKWYYETFIKGNYNDPGEYSATSKLKNFIEKMAVWYELRYPTYEVHRIIPFSKEEMISVDTEMFINNPYIREHVKNKNTMVEYNELENFNWSDFYNIDAFINSLPSEEREFLNKPTYNTFFYIDDSDIRAHFHLYDNGIVDESEGVGLYTRYQIRDYELKNMYIKNVKTLFEKRKIKLPKNNGIELTIKHFEERKYFREELLNCVMYRIIERGGNKVGPRRGLIFAKEFNRNIDIPIIYGLDKDDLGIYVFIDEYLKAGGNKYIFCYTNYFKRKSKNEKLQTIGLNDFLFLMKTKAKKYITKGLNDETYGDIINLEKELKKVYKKNTD